MTVTRRNSTRIARIADAVAAELAVAVHRPEGSYIQTPLMYPSGSYSLVRIFEIARDRFQVSDMGSGYEEARLLGAENIYVRVAKGVAENSGVNFEAHTFFVLEVARDQLAGAVATIANCSLEAVQITSLHAAERKHEDSIDRLIDRLKDVQRRAPRRIQVIRDFQLVGASTTEWHFGASVIAASKQTLFEVVASHHQSVVNAVAKFGDISRLENAPARVSVVKNRAELGTKLSLLSQTSSIIEENAPSEVYDRVALAA